MCKNSKKSKTFRSSVWSAKSTSILKLKSCVILMKTFRLNRHDFLHFLISFIRFICTALDIYASIMGSSKSNQPMKIRIQTEDEAYNFSFLGCCSSCSPTRLRLVWGLRQLFRAKLSDSIRRLQWMLPLHSSKICDI